MCVREMLEITEELLEKKVMNLIWGLSFTRHLATDIPSKGKGFAIVCVGSPPKTP